ncbi:MAG: TetR/AcrR family transcriptional regulator [Deltaproteobacteria bacterium]|nr:TetR/AcrR family transcriptional regulator [Deltaproteobacteria bacterium]MBW2051569.1 TetR/AcrR family transcriptional regulator [Deltaproteobacteria bacterium]MBW2139886.1 TetR/AcrR family transcriptional regulator [Deltaproteobacteria bacterium]MBW2324275.1 TetR/AcrR family transcriptional regulator [Deltaproteobacteria bacterium]
MKQEFTESTIDRNSRQRLLKSATELFAENGYAGTSVREIVARAGVTKPVLYYYFESKEGIFRAIMNIVMEKYEEILSEVFQVPGSSMDKLLFMYNSLSQTMIELPDIIRLFHRAVIGQLQGAPEFGLEKFPLKVMEVIKQIYNEGLARGEVAERDPDAVALLLLNLLSLVVHKDSVFLKSMNRDVPIKTVQLALSNLKRD